VRIEGKVALVTGAGSGIGRAVCVRLAEEGAEVVVTSLSPSHVEGTCDAVKAATGMRPRGRVVDIADHGAVDGAVRDTGQFDVLSNNAGVELPHEPAAADITDEEWERVLRVNSTGIFYACRAAVPVLRDGGSIVNMGSVNSLVARPLAAAYVASKGAVVQFSRALALELAPRRIRVNCVCPGPIDTPLTDQFLALADDPAAMREAFVADTALGRLGTPREIADCVLFLASDESSFVTGSALVADGGQMAR
jgi:NAD(P)-dependent dehydrogenase (short-subunit alcohol dehydrogenase family)